MELLTMDDLVQMTQLRRGHIYHMLNAGEFPAGYKIGRARRWERREIERFLESKKMRKNAPKENQRAKKP